MLELGGTHKATAFAVKDALEKLAPLKYRVEVVDLARAAQAQGAEHFLKRS